MLAAKIYCRENRPMFISGVLSVRYKLQSPSLTDSNRVVGTTAKERVGESPCYVDGVLE